MSDEGFLIEDGVLVRYVGGGESKVVVPQGVTEIGDFAFARCDTVAEVILPEGVSVIGEHAFMECSWLSSISLPDTLVSIGSAAFRSCDSLERIELPDRVSALPTACFYECLSLKDVKLPRAMKRICSRAFSGCSSIVSIDLPDGTEEIEEFAFEYCTILRRITLPDGLIHIGRHAFASCHELAEIAIPPTVKSVGSSAFYQTAFLEGADGDFVIGGDGILISCVSKAEDIAVPAGVKSIGELAFAYNERLRRVTLPDCLQEICGSAFERCAALEEISLPEGLRVIGSRAFEDCSSLAEISLPDGITQIGSGVFERTSVAAGDATLILNDKYLIAYRGGEECPQLPDTIELIAGCAFSGNTDIQSVTVGESVRAVCGEAFRWCRGLKEVRISANVRYLGEYAFAGCEKLHAYIERARRVVGECTFEEGQRLTFADGVDSFTVQLQSDLTAGSPEHALFAFGAETTEQRFMQMSIPEYMLPAAICYAVRGGVYAEYLRKNIVAAVCMAVDREDSELLRRTLEYGYLSERQAAECAAYAIKRKALEQQVIIMRFKQDSFGEVSDESLDDRFNW